MNDPIRNILGLWDTGKRLYQQSKEAAGFGMTAGYMAPTVYDFAVAQQPGARCRLSALGRAHFGMAVGA